MPVYLNSNDIKNMFDSINKMQKSIFEMHYNINECFEEIKALKDRFERLEDSLYIDENIRQRKMIDLEI